MRAICCVCAPYAKGTLMWAGGPGRPDPSGNSWNPVQEPAHYLGVFEGACVEEITARAARVAGIDEKAVTVEVIDERNPDNKYSLPCCITDDLAKLVNRSTSDAADGRRGFVTWLNDDWVDVQWSDGKRVEYPHAAMQEMPNGVLTFDTVKYPGIRV